MRPDDRIVVVLHGNGWTALECNVTSLQQRVRETIPCRDAGPLSTAYCLPCGNCGLLRRPESVSATSNEDQSQMDRHEA
jgi:hypothetical protein